MKDINELEKSAEQAEKPPNIQVVVSDRDRSNSCQSCKQRGEGGSAGSFATESDSDSYPSGRSRGSRQND